MLPSNCMIREVMITARVTSKCRRRCQPPCSLRSAAGLVFFALVCQVVLSHRRVVADERPQEIKSVELDSADNVNRTLVVCTLVYRPFVYHRVEVGEGAQMRGGEAPNSTSSATTDNGDGVDSAVGLESLFSFEEFMETFDGFDVELLSALRVTALNGSSIQVAVYNNFYSSLYSTRMGKCDLAIGAYIKAASRQHCGCPHPDATSPTITADHACCLEFSDTYASDGLAVMTRARMSMTPFQSFMETMLTQTSLTLWSVLLIALVISSNLVWYIERKLNSVEFPYPYVDGVSDGLWWSIVTMTTVGYGDKTPRTRLGRLIGVVWMATGVIMSGLIIGIVAESMSNARQLQLELRNIVHFGDLKHDRICSSSGLFAKNLHRETFDMEPIAAYNIQECYEMFNREEVDAVVGVRLEMLQQIHDGVLSDMTSLIQSGVEISRILVPSHFGVVFPNGSPYREYFTTILGFLVAGSVLYRCGYRLHLTEVHTHTPCGMCCLSPNTDVLTADQGWEFESARRHYMTREDDLHEAVVTDLKPAGDDGGFSAATLSFLAVAWFFIILQTLVLVLGPTVARQWANHRNGRVKFAVEAGALPSQPTDDDEEIVPRTSLWGRPSGQYGEMTRVEAAAMDIKVELDQLSEMVQNMNSVIAGVEAAMSRRGSRSQHGSLVRDSRTDDRTPFGSFGSHMLKPAWDVPSADAQH